MLSIDYKDWFINQKRIPDIDSEEYNSFFDFHRNICLYGANMNGVFINPFLYWHLNFWNVEIDYVDENGFIRQKYSNPIFRDNEWVVTNEIYKANLERKGLVIGGIRRFAKSVIESSYVSHGIVFEENSQNVVVGLNEADLLVILKMIEKGLNKVPKAWRWHKIEGKWDKEVSFGVKTKFGERYVFSRLIVRNLDYGDNEEGIAGTDPRRLIIDEAGKGSFLRALKSAMPGLTSPYGWKCSPIVTFTSGDVRKFNDARELMMNPSAYNFMEYNSSEDTKIKHGLFIPNKYRMEAKKKSNLAEFLSLDSKELSEVEMLVSDPEKAEKIKNDILEKNRKSSDPMIVIKEKMYFPSTIEEMFLYRPDNLFGSEELRKQKIKLESNGFKGTPVRLYMEDGAVKHMFTDDPVIHKFPHSKDDPTDAPIVIYEFPIPNAPYGLYVAGVDSYSQEYSFYSSSLGTVYIYKRMHDILGESYQDMFVASYAARPHDKNKWMEQARLLIKYYNALTLCENDEYSFIEYMKSKGDYNLLEKQPSWGMEIDPKTKVRREYGVSRTSNRIRKYLHDLLKSYLNNEYTFKIDGNQKVVKGVNMIFDIMLIEEMLQFNEDEGNYDRIVAAELALALAAHMDPIYGKVVVERKEREFNERSYRSHAVFRPLKVRSKKLLY